MNGPARRHRRWLHRILIAVAAVTLLLGVLVTAAFRSETMFRFALRAAEPLIPGELRYASLDGTLAGPVRAAGVEYTLAETRIQAETLAFDISPWALLRGDVHLDYLHARALVVALAPPAASASGPPQPRALLDALVLPLAIAADDVRIETFTLVSGGGDTLLQLDALRAAFEWNAERLAVTALDASGPQLELAGDATLGLDHGHASAFDLAGGWNGGAFPVRAAVRGDGDSRQLDLAVQLREPAQATLNARLENLLDAPAWQGVLRVASVQPSAFGGELPETPWSGEFRFEGDWQDTRIEGSARGGWPPATGIHASIEALANASRVHVETLDARVDAFDARLAATGELHYADKLAYTASGSITRFSGPGLDAFAIRDARFETRGDGEGADVRLRVTAGAREQGLLKIDGGVVFAGMRIDATLAGEDLVFDFDGVRLAVDEVSADVNGTPSDYAAALAGLVQVNELPAARAVLHASGDLSRLAAELETLQWLNGAAQGRITLAWQDGVRAGADMAFRGFDLGALDPHLRGRVGGNARAQAFFGDGAPDIRVQLSALSGEIAGLDLRGGGALRLVDNRVQTQGFDISAGDARVALEDAADGFDFLVRVPSLGSFHSLASGRLQARGHFDGRLASPSFSLQATGEGVSWGEYSANAFDLEADIAGGGERASSLRLEAGGIRSPQLDAQFLDLDLNGARDAHRLTLDTRGAGSDGSGTLRLGLQGGFRDGAWRGAVTQLAFAHAATGTWRLEATPNETLVISADDLRIPRHCLQGPSGHACAGPVTRDAQGWTAAGELRELPVGIIAGWLPGGLDYTGTINGEFQVDAGEGGLAGRAGFRLGAGDIRQAAGERAETLLGWTSGSVEARFDGRDAHASLAIALRDGGSISGSGALRMPANGTPAIDAELTASIVNLQLVPSLVPELSALEGRVTANLDVAGPLSGPAVRGEARLHDGRARILALGTDWENLDVRLVAEGREFSMTGHAESGDGHIDIDLEARDHGDGITGEATLTGRDFKAVQTPEANIDISPRLHLALKGRDLYVDGEVRVPFARIEPRDLSTARQPSGDQVIVNAETRKGGDGMQVHVAVTTQLGEDVRIDAFGLKARMEGALTVAQQPGAPATGIGRLVIAEGEYKAYGQDLTLTRGEIIYTGQPLSNPGLDIRAERYPQPDIMVGLAVRGPLAQPATSVYSEPSMSQTEALAWLLFGRPIEQATGEEEGQISEAAIALGLGGQKLLGNVGRRLGVEEIRVDDVGDRERASLVLGKYLSPDLYVSYGIGLFEAVNSFRIRYRISSRWTLEATSGLKSSADFLYTIER